MFSAISFIFIISNSAPQHQPISSDVTECTCYRASMENVVGSDYAGSHWLATFLMYALETRAKTVASL